MTAPQMTAPLMTTAAWPEALETARAGATRDLRTRVNDALREAGLAPLGALTLSPRRAGLTPPDMLLATGRWFRFDTAVASCHDATPHEIGHALAGTARFGGQTRTFYSVAEHAVLMARQFLPDEDGATICPGDAYLAYACLYAHAECAYLGDLPAGLQVLLPDYQDLRRQVLGAICARRGIHLPLPIQITHADLRVLATVERDLMPAQPQQEEPAFAGVSPLPDPIPAWYFATARYEWLSLEAALASIPRAAPQEARP